MVEPGGARIVSPQHDAVRFLEVGRRDPAAERIGVREILVPVADLGAVRDVGAAEGVDQAVDPANVVGDRRAARRGQPERDGLGAGLTADTVERGHGRVERLVPGDALPARIGIALGTRAPERIELALRVVDDLGRGATFYAQRPPRRMLRIRLLPDEAAVARDQNRAAARAAKGAESRRSRLCHRRSRDP